MARAFASPRRPSPGSTFNGYRDTLERILRTTRRDWELDILPTGPARQVRAPRRRTHLPRLAARALAAQIMAIRCRRVFAA